MKKYISLLALIILPFMALAQKKGYDIKVKFTENTGDEKLFLCRYFGKGFPEVYKIDSATVNSKGEFHFQKKDDFLGGMYIILYKNNSMWYDIVAYNGLKLDLTINPQEIGKSIVKGSKENTLNFKYLELSDEYGSRNIMLRESLKVAETQEDSNHIYKQIESQRNEFIEKRNKIVEEGKNTLFARIIKAIDKPVPPPGVHLKADGSVDSFFSFYYVKNHYWDNFDFTEERLIHTPILDSKLKDYFDNYVIPKPDSFQNEADILIAYTRSAPELFKYTLHFITNYARTSKFMGMDESFVYLVNKYYRAGDAFWLDSASLHKNYLNIADEWDKTKLGKIAPDFIMRDAYDFTTKSLHSIPADYTILLFWDITCGTCLAEVPAIDSLFTEGKLSDKNIQIYSIPATNDGKLESIHKVIEKLGVKKPYWNHSIDTDGTSRARQLYGVQSNPQLFILDKDKKIIGKKINHNNILKIIELEESKKTK